jgi:cob(I)alamin adenosyltransferase
MMVSYTDLGICSVHREGVVKVDAFVFSKRGDSGETSLLTGGRVSKANLRPEAYGTLDEASSAMGMAKAFTDNQSLKDMISAVQEDLLILGAELACEGEKQNDYRIESTRTLKLEQWIQKLQGEVPLPRHFVFPGANSVSAAVDLSRTIIRRAERRCVALRESGQLDNPEVHAYLNRLGDFLFTLARYAEEKG